MSSIKRLIHPLILLSCALVYGQGFTAAVVGIVTDAGMAAVARAAVTVTNNGTGVKRVVLTDTYGQYTVPQIPPGQYTVSVEAKNFKTATSAPTELQVDQQLRLDFALQVGAVNENVTVTSEGEQLQTENATVGTAVTSAQITELPLNGRQFFQLNLLVPGSAPQVQGSNLSGQGGSFEVHGLRETSNYFWIDGVDNTTQAVGEVVINPPEYSIQEFRVMSPTYDAQFGRTAGAQVNIITKSGGNDYHGDLYLFIRNSVFDAKNFFDPAGAIPAYRRGQYGGDLGGKIKKNRAFFYGAYEGLTYAQGESNSNIVPSVQETKGNFSDLSTIIRNPTNGQPFPGNIIPASLLSPTGLAVAAYYPAPNAPGNRLNVSPTGHNTDDVAVAKGDILISQNNHLSLRSAFEDNNFVYPIALHVQLTAIPGFGFNEVGAHNYTEGINDTHLFSPTLVGVFSVGWNRFEYEYFGQTSYSQSGGINYCAQLGILGCRQDKRDWAFPFFSLNGLYANLGGSVTEFGPFDTFFVNPSMTWVKGKHTVKFGFDYHRFTSDFEIGWGPGGAFTYRGTYSGNPLADLLLGYPFSVTQTVYQNNDDQALLVAPEFGAFVQDEYRITPHLTVTAGLRWEDALPATEQRNHLSNLNLPTQQVIIAGQNGVGSNVYTTDPYEFQPRIGFAWTPNGSDKWVVRGGYGIFNELTQINQALSLFSNPPFQNSYTIVGNGSTVTTSNALLRAAAANLPSFSVWPNRYKMGRVQQYSIEAQRRLTSRLALDIAYVGTKGDDLYGSVNLNTPPPGPGTVQTRRAYPQYTNVVLDEPAFKSRYNGLEIRVEKRMSNGLQFLASYTWSSAKDDYSVTGAGPQDPRDIAAAYGPSSYDIPQHFTLSYVYELPFGRRHKYLSGLHGAMQALFGGWQTNGIWTLYSGQPVTPVLAQDNLNTLDSNGEWPNLVGNPNKSSSTCQTHTPNCWWNATAFAYPAQYTFGTAGRNYLFGPGFDEFDFSLVKNYHFKERRFIEFRAEVFNLFNRVNFNNPTNLSLTAPAADSSSLNVTSQGSFGVITSAQPSRQIQLGMRLVF